VVDTFDWPDMVLAYAVFLTKELRADTLGDV
jgi:hypothetical protein